MFDEGMAGRTTAGTTPGEWVVRRGLRVEAVQREPPDEVFVVPRRREIMAAAAVTGDGSRRHRHSSGAERRGLARQGTAALLGVDGEAAEPTAALGAIASGAVRHYTSPQKSVRGHIDLWGLDGGPIILFGTGQCSWPVLVAHPSASREQLDRRVILDVSDVPMIAAAPNYVARVVDGCIVMYSREGGDRHPVHATGALPTQKCGMQFDTAKATQLRGREGAWYKSCT